MQSIFGTDGIRGRFNKEITYSLGYKVGYALGTIIQNNNPIIIIDNILIFPPISFQVMQKIPW